MRALARRLKVHHNTVSAAYQDLEAAGHVELQRGSGVFVRRAGAATLPEASGLDEMIRLALHTASARGSRTPEIRAAVERWLAAVPPDRVLVVDPSMEMAELLAHEIRSALAVPATPCTLDDLAREPGRAAGALTVVLPYHVEAVRRAAPGAAVEVVTLEVSAARPPGHRRPFPPAPSSSSSPTPRPSCPSRPSSCAACGATRCWRRRGSSPRRGNGSAWSKAADLVLADALSVEAVRKASPRRLREVRVVPEAALARLRKAVTAVVPKSPALESRAAEGPEAPEGARRYWMTIAPCHLSS